MAITLSAFCLAIVTVSVLGGVLPLATVLTHTRLQVYLSFSAGTMLGAVFFHMMPEAVRLGSTVTIPWAAVGLLSLFFLERFFSFHHHEPPSHTPAVHSETRYADHTHPTAIEASRESQPDATPHDVSPMALFAMPWSSAAFGLVVHSLVGGVALGSAVAADYDVHGGPSTASIGVFIATLVHKPADALTITSLMLRAGSPRRVAHLVNFAFALMIPVGVVLFSLGLGGIGPTSASNWTAGALAFSAGTFLCVALSDLLPELQFHAHDRVKLSFALLAGVALMGGAAAFEPGEHEIVPPIRTSFAGHSTP
jgi:zinc and cadmium transporter